MRKPRSDSKLLNLPQERRDEILDLLEMPGVSLKAAQAELAKQGLRCAPSSLSHFYSQEKSKRLIAQRLQSLSIANAIGTEAKASTMFDGAMIERISQLAFEISIQSNADPDVVRQFFKMVLEARQQELDSRKVALLEDKARQAEAAVTTLGDGKLTAEEQMRRIRQIFGAS